MSVAMRKSPWWPGGGPRWWPVKSPHPSFVVSTGSLRPWAVTVAVPASHRTAQGASIEVCEGTDGHHCRLPRGGHLPWGRRDLRHHAQDREAGHRPARGRRRRAGAGAAGPQLRRGRRAGGRAGGEDEGADLGEAAAAGRPGRGVCGVGAELPAAGRGGEAGVAAGASPGPPAGGVVAG